MAKILNTVYEMTALMHELHGVMENSMVGICLYAFVCSHS